MARIIYIDGPEKAGKSTLIEAIREKIASKGIPVSVRKWGPVKPDDRQFAPPLQEDLNRNTKGYVIWDRGWVSEHVYGTLLNRQRRGASNPWLLEWLHGRAVNGHGTKIILLPYDVTEAMRRHDDTDLPVSAADEARVYQNYARRFGYNVLYNHYTEDSLRRNIRMAIGTVEEHSKIHPRIMSSGTEALRAPRLIVGEERNPNDYKTMPGAWMPFSSAKTTQFVQKYFGDDAMMFSWTNAADIENGLVDNTILQAATAIYTFGNKAYDTVAGRGIIPAGAFAHPGFFTRWNTDRGRKALMTFETEYKKVFSWVK